jgi:basic membrane protein A and related proteins
MMRAKLARNLLRFVGVATIAIIATSASADKLKIGVLLPGPTTDNGYDADGGRTAEALKSQLNADVQVTENVPVANQADLYRQYAAKGYDVVIGWGGQFTDGAVQVAQEFPKVKFIVVNSGAENGKNLATIDIDVEQWEFLGGFVTAKLSKTGVIGWVGGQCFPATAANLHGVEQGAKYANASTKVLSTFTGDFEDPTKAQQAAQAMIDSGKAGALTGNLNNGYFGVFKAAQQNGKIPVVTEWADNHTLAPDVIASSIQKSQAKWVVTVVKAIGDGSFKGKHYQFGLTKDWGPVMSKTNLLPQSLYDEALALQSKVASGEVKPQRNTDCPK